MADVSPTIPAWRRTTQVARNIALLATTTARHLADDPLLLVVQVARRLPRSWRSPLARLIRIGSSPRRPGVRNALGEFVADRPAHAAALIADSRPPRNAIGLRLLGELAVALGQEPPASGASRTRARGAWNRGDITAAVRMASTSRGSSRYAARLESEQETMQHGFRLAAVPARRARAARGSSPRVLHMLTNSVPHTQSGYAVRSHEILKAQLAAGIYAQAVTRVGYPVTVGRPLAQDLDVVDRVRYHRLLPMRLADTPTARLQQMVQEALPLVEQQQSNVLHTTTNFTNALVTEALARSMQIPWVYEVRGLLEETWLASRHPSIRAEAAKSERYALLRAKEAELMRAADHVVVLSEVSRMQLVERGIPADRITIVPNAIDETLVHRDLEPADARARLGLPVDGFWIGSVSSLVDYEGFPTLLEAVAMLRREGHDVRVALAGDGVARPALISLAADLGISDSVTLPGAVPRYDAWLWYRALNVFTVPRRDLAVCREVTPLKPIEAMAAGRPIIASDLPALREVIAEPSSGLLVEPEDPEHLANAIIQLLDSPQLRDRYREAGRLFAATRTWQRNAELYQKIYANMGVTT